MLSIISSAIYAGINKQEKDVPVSKDLTADFPIYDIGLEGKMLINGFRNPYLEAQEYKDYLMVLQEYSHGYDANVLGLDYQEGLINAYVDCVSGNSDNILGLSSEDIKYISSLGTKSGNDVAAIKSDITGHYTTIILDEDADNFIDINEDNRILLTKVNNERKIYSDVLIDMYSTDLLEDGDMSKMITVGEFIEGYDMESDGYCIPTFDSTSSMPSEEALETISEVYGKDVAICVRLYGLPIPYYNGQSFYDAVTISQAKAVKELKTQE